MEYSCRFRLHPSLVQKALIEKAFSSCRLVHNRCLATRKVLYVTKKKVMNHCACSKDMTGLKEALPRLRDVDSAALQSSLKGLDAAYRDFFRKAMQKGGICPNLYVQGDPVRPCKCRQRPMD